MAHDGCLTLIKDRPTKHTIERVILIPLTGIVVSIYMQPNIKTLSLSPSLFGLLFLNNKSLYFMPIGNSVLVQVKANVDFHFIIIIITKEEIRREASHSNPTQSRAQKGPFFESNSTGNELNLNPNEVSVQNPNPIVSVSVSLSLILPP